jgi:hypothetical protein
MFTRSKIRTALNNYATTTTNVTKNPKSTLSECVAADNAGAVILKPPADVSYNSLPHVFYAGIRDVLANPGVYTWMLFKDGAFVAARTLTAAELHSKHYDLYERYGQKPVVIAGEMAVDAAKNVRYNFLSGTFMGQLLEDNPAGYDEAKFRAYMEQVLRMEGAASVAFVPAESFVPSVVATQDTLQRYRDLGYSVLKFDTVHDCKTYVVGERGRKPYMDALKRKYDAVARFSSSLPPYDVWVADMIAKEKPIFTRMKQPANYFAAGVGGGKSRRKTRKSRR